MKKVKRKRIAIMWMKSPNSSLRVLSLPLSLFYIFVGILIFSWVVLGIGGYVAKGLYYECLRQEEKNSYLLQKERELEELRQTMENIRRDETTLLDYLGLYESTTDKGVPGKGR